jgi:hypothetical protein
MLKGFDYQGDVVFPRPDYSKEGGARWQNARGI